MGVWFERFALPVLEKIFGAVLTKLWQHSRRWQGARIVSIIVLLVLSGFAAQMIEKQPAISTKIGVSSPLAEPSSTDGQGGKGGGGNAIGKDSVVLGGRGGRGGGPGGGRGGNGGGGDAVGEGSMVIGGDGGGGGRSDGRGGAGGASPLKRLSPEKLKFWGLTGNEGYGQGGRGANSAEYDRSLKVLSLLSAEYASQNPGGHMVSMPGVLMPPVDWVNDRLSQMHETFRIELIDNGTDFFLHRVSQH